MTDRAGFGERLALCSKFFVLFSMLKISPQGSETVAARTPDCDLNGARV
jgi:hypothetical protein